MNVTGCATIVSMTDTQKMSGAELKVMLTGLGLTPGWLAERLNVTSRTILRWMDQDEVPAKAVAAIAEAADTTTKEIERITHIAYVAGFIYTHRTDDGVAERNTLPATWHRHLTFRALNDLRSQGVPVTVAYA